MVDLSERPGANPQGMPKIWQQKILYRNQKANLSKPHGSTNLLLSKKSPLSGPMYHQISKRHSVSQEQNILLKSQNPGNGRKLAHMPHLLTSLTPQLPTSLPSHRTGTFRRGWSETSALGIVIRRIPDASSASAFSSTTLRGRLTERSKAP